MASFPRPRLFDRSTPPHILTLVLMAGLATLSMSVFLPSLPGMTAYFQTDYWILQLSVAVYLGVNAVLQVIVGPISDNIGRRPVVIWGIVLFLLATLGCIYAPNAGVFLLFRMCQAIIVTSMVLSRAIVRDVVPGAEAASMIAYVTMGMAVVPMVGPVAGGFLDQYYGWKASFWLMVILGVALLWLVWTDLGETKRASGQSLLEQFGEYPELLRSPRFWGYALASGFTSGAFFAFLGGAPIIGTEFFGFSPSEVGLFFGAPALGYFVGNYISGRFSIPMGVNWMVMTGTIIGCSATGLSLIIFAIGIGGAFSFFGLVTLVGVGNGMTIPNAASGMLSVRPHLAGTASGLGGAIMIGLGAGTSAIAGAASGDGSNILPLLWLMFATTAAGLIAAILVILRSRSLSR